MFTLALKVVFISDICTRISKSNKINIITALHNRSLLFGDEGVVHLEQSRVRGHVYMHLSISLCSIQMLVEKEKK